MSSPAPPHWLEAVLRRILPPADRDALVGDMAELYAARIRQSGRGRALWWYARHTGHFAVALLLAAMSATFRGIGAELRRAARRLLRAPVFTMVSVLTVAVGIGAFTSLYGVVDSVLLEPPPYRAPDQLVWIWRDYWFGLHRGWLGGPDIVELRRHEEAFDGVVAFRSGGANLTGRGEEAPRRVRVTLASADFFDVLGVAPTLGRGFAQGEDAPGADAVAVLSDHLWRSQYGADPSVLGKTVYLDGRRTTVVGVAPADFHFVVHSSLGAPAPEADLYVPLRMDLAAQDPGSGMFAGLARVREGATRAQVQAALDAVGKDLTETFGGHEMKLWRVGLLEDLVSAARPALLILLAAAGALMLILGANLATLLLGRSTSRDRELAVAAALGAGRLRLLQSVLAEGALVCGAGAAIGIGLGWLGTGAMRTFAPSDLPRRLSIHASASVLLVALGATAVMGVAALVLPSLRSLRPEISRRLRDGAARAGEGFSGSRTRSALVIAQVAMSLVLLAGAGLLTRAFQRLVHADPGFDGRSALTFQVSLPEADYPDGTDIVEFDRRLRAALEGVAGVRVVGATGALPLSASASQNGVSFPGAPGNTGGEEDGPLVDQMFVGPGYAEAVGLRLLAGRFFTEHDDASAPGVVLIDDVLRARFFPKGGAVGRGAVVRGDTVTIVGVVDQARMYRVDRDGRPQVYVPLEQKTLRRTLHYVVAGPRDPGSWASDLRRLVDTVDPSVPISQVSTLRGIVDDSLSRERLSLSLLVAFAAAALLLATLGLYGVVSNGVTRRARELGVRMALGADRGRLVAMVLRDGMRLAALGALIGLVGALASARALRSAMDAVEPYDPLVFGVVTLLLVLVTGVAAWLPARRATRIDPCEALRSE